MSDHNKDQSQGKPRGLDRIKKSMDMDEAKEAAVNKLAEKMGGSHQLGNRQAPNAFMATTPINKAFKIGMTFDEKYARHTVYIERNLGERIENIANIRRGEKTKIINRALAMYFADPKNVRYHLTNNVEEDFDELVEMIDDNIRNLTESD